MDITREISAVANGRRVLSALRHDTLYVAGIVVVLVVAVGLRFQGLQWDAGFDYTPHPDERAILFNVSDLSPPSLGELGLLLDADESPWNPRWFPYGSFPLYLLKGMELSYGLVQGEELRDLRYAGRAMSALADVVTVLMVFLLGSRVYDRRVGLLAAALTALAVIHIQLSHFFAVDTLQALLTILAIFFMYRVARGGRLRDSLLAGAFIGLGLATKVSQAPILAAFVVAHVMYVFSMNGASDSDDRPFESRLASGSQGLVLGGGALLAVLFVAQPYAFLDWSRFFGDVTEQSEMVRRIRDYPYTRQYENTPAYLYHIRQLTVWGLGWPLGIVAWAGLVFVSLRGMRLRFGLAYLIAGWLVPVGILLLSNSFFAIIVATGIALVALLATLPLRSAASRMDVLLLSWVVPLFLITGSFQVKFMRYLVPITPFLLLFGSRLVVALWDAAPQKLPAVRPLLAVSIALLIGFTGFYALSYVGLYGETHTAVRASDWINRNAPKKSVILKEHWEEGLPNLSGYTHVELPLYDDDNERKLDLLTSRLEEGDYLVFFSNRLYGTIPRLPDRYPNTGAYYELLFSDQLGYELVDIEATYPNLAGVGFVDDTFSRPNLPEPLALRDFKSSPIMLNLGFADESFSVYDHPKVLVFQNTGKYDADTLRRLIEEASPSPSENAIDNVPGSRAERGGEGSGDEIGLLLSTEDARSQREGGTWSDIIRPDSWTARFPVLSWLLVVEGISLLILPVTLIVFRPLADRGYLLSKSLGLLMVGLIVWLLASTQLIGFSRASLAVALLLVTFVSLILIVRNRDDIVGFVRRRWSLIVIGEVIFLVAFFAFLMIRMANPDLWHPFRGGEKPMDLAYLNAVTRSTFFPPYDPWFGGGYINYYYWGQFIVGMLVRATGISTDVAYNLAVPLFFALTAGGAFSVVYNLAEGTRRRVDANGLNFSAASLARVSRGAVAAGIAGALFVVVLGNLDGAIQVVQGAWRAMFLNAPFGEFDFWRSSRMMAPDPPGFEITEFPFFTFLFADLHAHLIALPFTILVLGTSLAVVLGGVGGSRWGGSHLARLAILGIAVHSLRLINTWDFPTYLMVGVAAVFVAEFFAHGGLGLIPFLRAGVKSAFMLLIGFIAFLPFQLTYETFFNSVESTTNTTVLWQFLAISGLFIFIIGSYVVLESRHLLGAMADFAIRKGSWLVVAIANADEDGPASEPRIGVTWVVTILLGTLAVGFLLTAIFSGAIGSTIPFVVALTALVAFAAYRWLAGSRPDAPYLAFVAMIVLVSLGLIIGLDVFRVEGDIDRMNSVFKFYLQVWVMLALASAYLLWRFVQYHRLPVRMMSWGHKAWIVGLVALIASASIFPVLGTQDRLRDRFDGNVTPLTLNGTAYIENTVYRDREGQIDLAVDFEGIEWLRANVEGSPIVLEGVTPTYRWGGRISIYTGLPSVVGWQWHQEQQRWAYRKEVGSRIRDVGRIYKTSSVKEATTLIDEYDVEYIYVGQLEKLYYEGSGLAKFETLLDGRLSRVFENDQVAIYRVID